MPKGSNHKSASPKARKRSGKTASAQQSNGANGARTSQSLFFSLLNSLDIGVANCTAQGLVLYANDKFADLLGFSGQEMAESSLKDFVSRENWRPLSLAIEHGAAVPVQGSLKILGPEVRVSRTISMSFAPICGEGKPTTRIVATEVTKLVETTKALKQSEASLHSVSVHLLHVQDEERRRVARDLHDITGQELATVVMSLDRIARTLGSPGVDSQHEVKEAAEMLREVESQIRTLSYVLHPPMLDEMGLGSAIRWYIEGFSKRTGIHVEINVEEDLPRLEPDKEMALFRVMQEAMTNVFRHSGSRTALITLALKIGCLEVSIEDKGKGFDAERLSPSSGVGIQSMRGRLELFGGDLNLISKPQHTQVVAKLPLQSADGALPTNGAGRVTSAPSGGLPEFNREITGRRWRVLIADDHEVARQGIKTLLSGHEEFEICGEAFNGLEAVEKTGELQPDLLILDLSMPQIGGFSAANQIRRAGFSTKILIYTTHSYPALEQVARAAGCEGFVLKSNAFHDLLRAARIVLEGGQFFGQTNDADAKVQTVGG